MNLVKKQKDTHRLRERTYGCQGKRIVREIEMDMYILLYSKWITNKDLLYRHGTLLMCQPHVPAWMGGGVGREWIHVYI